ncbi:MAG TPA: type VI secretion system baseplate subunit TssE [Phycisphaerales bacterium]|nr:type VI secretion system baseplate subunit TssE [Phycisphaerales bacterium]
MAELTTADKLQPSLLDRLRDDAPKERQESRDRRVMSMRQLREAVLRDLSWLLNSGCHPLDDEIYEFPLVARSTVNYGMPDLTGRTASNVTPDKLEQMVLEAVAAFEPRIMRRTLAVKAVSIEGRRGDSTGNTVGFEISGELCPLPMPEPLYLRTALDLETGRCEIKTGTKA